MERERNMHLHRLITKAGLMGAALFVSVLLAASSASGGQVRNPLTGGGVSPLVIDGLEIEVSYVMEGTETITWDSAMRVARIFWHFVEQDTFTAANGKTLVSQPYAVNLEWIYRDFELVAMNSSGVCTRVPLPGGGMFTCAGTVDWLQHQGEPYVLFPDRGGCSNLEGFIAALSPVALSP
jgi:hypothetical protein